MTTTSKSQPVTDPEVNKLVEQAEEQGFYGEKVDPADNTDYTVAGVLKRDKR